MVYLFGKKSANVYTLLALIFIFLGTTMSNDLVWELSDMLNQLMVIPNFFAIVALGGLVAAAARKGSFARPRKACYRSAPRARRREDGKAEDRRRLGAEDRRTERRRNGAL